MFLSSSQTRPAQEAVGCRQRGARGGVAASFCHFSCLSRKRHELPATCGGVAVQQVLDLPCQADPALCMIREARALLGWLFPLYFLMPGLISFVPFKAVQTQPYAASTGAASYLLSAADSVIPWQVAGGTWLMMRCSKSPCGREGLEGSLTRWQGFAECGGPAAGRVYCVVCCCCANCYLLFENAQQSCGGMESRVLCTRRAEGLRKASGHSWVLVLDCMATVLWASRPVSLRMACMASPSLVVHLLCLLSGSVVLCDDCTNSMLQTAHLAVLCLAATPCCLCTIMCVLSRLVPTAVVLLCCSDLITGCDQRVDPHPDLAFVVPTRDCRPLTQQYLLVVEYFPCLHVLMIRLFV
jgi:hypothetical protein